MTSSLLSRRQGFEFCDQAWPPACLREGYLDCLSFLHRLYQPYGRLFRPIIDWAGNETVLDLASGSGEQVAQILRAAKKQGRKLPRFILSDIFPDHDAYRKLQDEFGGQNLNFAQNPLPVSALSGRRESYWSIFSSFHHLQPTEARELLREASERVEGICIAEITQRKLLAFLLMPLGFPFHMLAPFFSKRFTALKFLFTTLIPVVPAMVVFDGLVSVLRSYTKEEILELLPQSIHEKYEIRYEEAFWRFLPPLKSSIFCMRRKEARDGE